MEDVRVRLCQQQIIKLDLEVKALIQVRRGLFLCFVYLSSVSTGSICYVNALDLSPSSRPGNVIVFTSGTIGRI